MEQFDFDDLLRHKLDKAGAGFAPTDMEWGDLSARLTRRLRLRHWLMWGGLATVLVLLLGGNLYWLNQNRQLKSEVLKLVKTTEPQQNKVIIDQTDTVFRRTTVVLYDTIYVQKQVFKKGRLGNVQSQIPTNTPSTDIGQPSGKKPEVSSGLGGIASDKTTNLVENPGSTGSSSASISSALSSVSENSTEFGIANTSKISLPNMDLLPMLPLKNVSLYRKKVIPEFDFLQPAPTKVSPKFQPKVAIGLAVGSSKIADKDVEHGGSAYIGVRATAQVWRRFSLMGELGIQQIMKLQSESLNTLPHGTNPPIVPPNLSFDEWEVRRIGSVNFQVGAKYRLFSTTKKWSPYLISGYQASNFGRFETTFDYKDENNAPVRFSQMSNHQDRFSGAVFGALGAEFQLKNRLHLMLESSAVQTFEKGRADNLFPQINLKLGAVYQF